MILLTYAQPILLSVVGGRRKVANAPWSLGKFGYPINGAALLFIAFGSVAFCFPVATPFDVNGMSKSVLYHCLHACSHTD